MNNWIEAAEEALQGVFEQTQIPYEFEFWNEDERGKPPDVFIVYFIVSRRVLASADNRERSTMPRVQVSMFYRNIHAMLTYPKIITQKMEQAGFRRFSEGRIPFQKENGFYGWRCDYTFYEKRS